MKKTWGMLAVFVLLAITVLTACGGSEGATEEGANNAENNNAGEEAADEEQVTIGVTQIVEHTSLDAAFEGFKQGLADSGFEHAEFNVQNAQNDPTNNQTIAENLASSDADLIFANSTPSAQAALNATSDIPIVFTSVTDPVEAKLVDSMENPGKNATGTTDTHPDAIPNTVKFIDEQMDDVTTVGTVYDSGETNSRVQVERIKEAMEGTDLELVEKTVSNSNEVLQSTEALVGQADAIYIITDNTVVSGLESVLKVAYDNDIPTFVGELDSVRNGGLAAYGFDYEDIGYQAGKMAAEILQGNNSPAQMPVEYPEDLRLLINEKAAEEMGVDIKPEWEEMAEFYSGE